MRVLALGCLLALAGCIEEHPLWVEQATAVPEESSEDGNASGDGDELTSSSDDADETTTESDSTESESTESESTESESTESGGDGDSGTTTGPLPTHQVFVTSALWLGDFGSLEQADLLCQEAADSASLGGAWKAIISDASASASERLTINGPVENLAGDVIAENATELWSGAIQNAIQYNEFGSPSGATAWTGTHSDGSHLSGFDCDGWTAPNNNSKGYCGWPEETSNYWVYGNWEFCTQTSRGLYCLSQ